MAQESEFADDRAGAAEWSEESPAAEAPRPFFTFWRCCGCLAFIGVALFLAVGIGAKWVRDLAFELEPMPIPETQVSAEEAERIAERWERDLAAGELVRMTPEELTIVLQHGLSRIAELGPETRFYAAATPEKLLDLRLRLQFPAEEKAFPWFMRGRFANVAMVGTLTVENGAITDALLTSYRFAGFQEGKNVSEQESKQLLEGLREQSRVNPQLKATVERVKLFRFDGERVELQLDPQ